VAEADGERVGGNVRSRPFVAPHEFGRLLGVDGKLDRHREWEAALSRREWACHSVTSAATINDDQVYKFLFDLTDGGNWLVDVHATS